MHKPLLTCVVLLILSALSAERATAEDASGVEQGGDSWAVVLSASRYLFNYRHTTNALSMYHLLQQHGMDDEHILLFISDNFACDPRNPYPAAIYSTSPALGVPTNLYGNSAQVDYAGDDVDVRRFLQVLQGRYDRNTPPTRRLLSDENSTILIYIAGHGARANFKFHDSEFLSASNLAETFSMMHAQRRYKKILFLVDTCRGIAMCESIRAPNVVCLASSSADHDSYSEETDAQLGVQLISRWTQENLRLLEGTQCRDRTVGRPDMMPRAHSRYAGVSPLHQPLYQFNYSPERFSVKGHASEPAHRDAVNDAGALHLWTIAEFLCGRARPPTPVRLRYDLL